MNTYMEDREHLEEGEGETIARGCAGGMHPKFEIFSLGTTLPANWVSSVGSFKRNFPRANLYGTHSCAFILDPCA